MRPDETDARQFCVYVHGRPDGSAFYVGKGLLSRAYDFAPSRRTAWHRNIVAKYGRDSIQIEVNLCQSERAAFDLERAEIARLQAEGAQLANLTLGGEGAAGHKSNARQLAALALARGKDRLCLSDDAKARIKAAHLRNLAAWKQSPAGKEHLKRLGEAGTRRLHAERTIACQECGAEHKTRSAKARFCSRRCEQRSRRAKEL